MPAKIAIVIYSMHGHIAKSKAGVEGAGGAATIYRAPETLPQEILEKMCAPAKPAYPVIAPDELIQFDGFIFGIPARFVTLTLWQAFWDTTDRLWSKGALSGKYVAVFVSTATPGGGQKSTAMNMLSNFTHHGIIFVPLGYSHTFPQQTNMTEVHGSSAWGAGTFAGSDGSRDPSELELEIAGIQGSMFHKTIANVAK
ncbi:uncharacterized protein PHACADRAFT_141788 [Phanerochaete carnosa HHB-10118-sp]|uniref:Flavodoxin-like domain-containing protein n=1 Tax=Phanerochaete carnosa (strain HHB-10118-sp) TaxID=650164 RepID=K5WCA0_PHACS|nr:uncharacterized protein PHACADRAFT_141788 [Phanerochaete carnosa HHB-10118-sp]EKM56835.1 hypothetical protein PHACADRAFT_141788 [Phanerochaete carnosa HHB-10118-sp]